MPLAFRFRICWLLVICGYWSKNKSPESGRERIENTHSNDKRVKKTKNRNKLHAICEGKNKNTRKYARRINEREDSKKENDKKRKQTSVEETKWLKNEILLKYIFLRSSYEKCTIESLIV